MQTKLLLSLLVAAPLFAQEAAQEPAAKKDETPQALVSKTQVATPEITKQAPTTVEPWSLAFIPTTISIEFGLIKENKSVDKTAWKNLKKMTGELATLINDKKLEQAALLFDTINSNKPEDVKSIITIKTSVRGERLTAHVCYTPINTHVTKINSSYFTTICEINSTNIEPEVWKEITTLVLETVKANQELSYEQTKQLTLTIAAKS